jgi:uncharacterized protein (TIGR03437 family)
VRRAALAAFAFPILCVVLRAQPGIAQNGVINAASQIAPTLAGGAIARGALFVIHGIRLGAPGRTSVTIAHNGVTAVARILNATTRRIDARMPPSAPLGDDTLVVTAGKFSSRPFRIQVAEFNPGLFSRNGEGWGPGRVDNVAANGAHTSNTAANPARPGQTIVLAATGLNGEAATVVIGDRAARSGPPRPTARPGEDEITVKIPPGAPAGCYVPIYIEDTPDRASNVVTAAIRSGSGPCESLPFSLAPSERIGVASLSRTRLKARTPRTADAIVDDARISFIAAGAESRPARTRLLPPPGTCTMYTSSYQAGGDISNSISSIAAPEGRGLDAGASLILARRGASRSIGEGWHNPGSYHMHLGAAGPAAQRGMPAPFLDPGEYTLTGPGGKDVAPFRIRFEIPPPFTWTDRDRIATIQRSRGVTVHWRGAGRGQLMLIVARNVDQITTAIGMCLCVAHAEAGHFTIPPAMLANVPISRDLPGEPFDELVLGAFPAKPREFHAPGIEAGFLIPVYADGRRVDYR